jgi:NADH-quinone oxidoreductase subunit C
MQAIYKRLKQQFKLTQVKEQKPDLMFMTATRKQLRPLLHNLRDKEGFTHLVLLTAVDWIEEQQFQLTYLLHNRELACDIGIRLMLDRNEPEMESIHDIWPTAETYQRELREMFGIDFPDSPGVDEEFILEGWNDIPPYRRDFDTLKYAEESYHQRPGRETHDPETYMKQQLYPDES